MISFRYHLVSIVAVFLALALGIVVGTTALSGPITKDLRNQLDNTKKQRDNLANQVKVLQGQVADAGQFASTYGSHIVSGTLTGKSVLLVVLPGATSGMQSGVTQQVSAAGGKVSGVVTITSNYLDRALGSGIQSLATGSAHPISWTSPVTSDPGQLGGSLLSYVLTGKGEKTDLTQVLGGFSALHMVSLGSSTVTPSTLVMVLGHGSKPNGDYGINAELSLVTWLVKDGGKVVVAGDSGSAQQSGLIASLRDSASYRGTISTVDDADSALDQVSSVLALAAAQKGQLGNYGTGSGADALFPAPPK